MKRRLSQVGEWLVVGAILVILVAIVLTIGKSALDLVAYLREPVDVATRTIVVDGLDVVVLFELYVILNNYRLHDRVSVLHVLDTSLFFVLRELLVEIAQSRLTLSGAFMYVLLLAAVGGLRGLLAVGEAKVVAASAAEEKERAFKPEATSAP